MTPPEKDKNGNKIPSEKIYVQRISCSVLDKSFIEDEESEEDKKPKIIDKVIRNIFENNLKSGIQTIENIQAKGILLPYKKNGKEVYVKKLRVRATKIANPIELKKHKDVSSKDYKQMYYVDNDENYLIAIYQGKDNKNKIITEKIVVNLLSAVKNQKEKKKLYDFEIEKKDTILTLHKVLKIGTIVIFKQNEDEDVFSLSKEELFSRVYRVFGIEGNGTAKFSHVIISEARNNKNKNDVFRNSIPKYKRISVTSVPILVENTDFKITPSGEIIKL